MSPEVLFDLAMAYVSLFNRYGGLSLMFVSSEVNSTPHVSDTFLCDSHLSTTHVDASYAVMLSLDTTTPSCYFTYNPPTRHHFSTETPCCSPFWSPNELSPADPENPLLAYRQPHSPAASSHHRSIFLMQAQTSAAHGRPASRPQPHPIQNVLYTSSDDAAESDDSTSSLDSALESPPELARCSRCQRTPSLDVRTGKSNMVSYGLNLWYCTRCAAMVGLPNR